MGSARRINSHTGPDLTHKGCHRLYKKPFQGWGFSSVAELLPTMCKAFSLIPSTEAKKKKKKKNKCFKTKERIFWNELKHTTTQTHWQYLSNLKNYCFKSTVHQMLLSPNRADSEGKRKYLHFLGRIKRQDT